MSCLVRFAPSPTGYLHIGNTRTALINYLFARKHEGKFLLRIDDTDAERSEKRYEESIYEDLTWLGFEWDLFFKQSDRLDRYRQVMQEFIDTGRLYPCYETPEELDFKRKRQLSKGMPPIYDRASLQLTAAQKQAYEQEGRKPHWRFLLKEGKIFWNDLIRGDVSYESEHLSDPVLVKGDGSFLYTLTSVVDDFDYNITHILRGEDHVTNTAVQLQIFEVLNKGLPFPISLGHTTHLMDKDGGPLSKRLGSLGISTLREQEAEPLAVCSFLARLGTSLPIEPFYSFKEICESFDLSSFSRNAPRFDEGELFHLNEKYLHGLSFEKADSRLGKCSGDKEVFWNIIRGNLKNFSEVARWKEVCWGELSSYCQFTDTEQFVLNVALQELPVLPWNNQTWKNWTSVISEKTGQKGRALFMPLRKALTGFEHGPEMKDLILLIGHERVKERLLKSL